MAQIRTPESEGDPEVTNTRGRVRTDDRSTSQEAAARLSNGILRESQQQVYDHLMTVRRTFGGTHPYGGATDDEIRAALGTNSKSGPATRRGELERAGWVRAHVIDGVTQRRASDSGQPMTVWVAVTKSEYTGPQETARQAKTRERHEYGLRVARQVAAWEIGDANWAEQIVAAYLDPEAAQARLDEEMGA